MSLRDFVAQTLPMMDEEWKDAVLYAPYQKEQALIYQYADTLAVRAFLMMTGLPYALEQRPNAEFMSPTTGEVPFLRVKETLVAEFFPIVDLVGKKGISLSKTLSAAEQADMYAFCALIEETLRIAEKYLSWVDQDTYTLVTKCRYGSVYRWPLTQLLPMSKRREMLKYLKDAGWADLSLQKVVERADKCFHALSIKLGHQRFFVGEQATELDALAFGHLYTILTTEMPNGAMVDALKKYPNLITFCENIDKEYFSES
uniref:Metaxin-2 n=1 Tax=Globodera rostochiensis TaxID=31243 RepID=A0A914GX53_GLORO